MRPVVLQFWITLDGYSCDPIAQLPEFLGDVDDPQQGEYFTGRLRQAGTHIMGRATYEGMAGYWPSSDSPIAPIMNEIPKVVFSGTLQSADWPDSRIADGDTSEEIAKLKAEPGGEILAHGGVQFAQSLARLDLVDEYRLWLVPVAVSRGMPLFCALGRPLTFSLVSSTTFPSGLVELAYSRASRGQYEAPLAAVA
jgi:dihydrofolate reductase